jgi:hypothetical protein
MRVAIAVILSLVIPTTASAVLIDGPDGSLDVEPFPIAALNNVGTRGGLSAVYVGNGIVITANHVGAGDVSFGRTTYRYVPGSAVRLANGDGSYADLLMFEIHPWPDLPALAIQATTPLYGDQLMLAGNGLDRGTPLVWDPNGASAPGPTGGYAWASQSHLRWGTNNCEVYPTGVFFGTHVFGSFFDAGRTTPEAQAVPGDSGGAVFTPRQVQGWKLAGVIIGIVQYGGQPASTSFYGQRSYYADLSYYRGQIVQAVSMPEPDRMLGPGAALLALLAAVRRARERGQLAQPLFWRSRATASCSVLSPPIG